MSDIVIMLNKKRHVSASKWISEKPINWAQRFEELTCCQNIQGFHYKMNHPKYLSKQITHKRNKETSRINYAGEILNSSSPPDNEIIKNIRTDFG